MLCRCHRLNRPCHPAEGLRRRNDKKQHSSDDRIAKLEGTVGQLMSLLQAANVNVGITNSIGDLGDIENVGDMGNVHGNRVDAWSRQQQQQKSPPQQQLHHPQNQQEQQPPSQPMFEVETAKHPTAMMHTSPSITSQDMATEGTGRIDTMEESRATLSNEDDDTETNTAGASASWWETDNANGLSANGIPMTTQASTVLDVFMSPSVSPPSALVSLERFRSQMLHHFPFIHLPVHLTTEQLRLERPFLFRAIVCVTSVSAEDKRERSLELKRVLCETVFMQLPPHQKQQTVDLLLGLLVYIAWGWEHLRSRRSLSRLMAVATSLAGELQSLDQVEPNIARTISRLEPKGGFDDAYSSTTATAATTPGTRATNDRLYFERQRAILGCFVLGMAVSTYFSQVDAPRWTPQMDEGLAAIIANSSSTGVECPSDAALAIQVRLQLLTMKAAQVWEHAQLPGDPPPETLSPQTLSYIKVLMGQLQELRASVPPAFQQHFGRCSTKPGHPLNNTARE